MKLKPLLLTSLISSLIAIAPATVMAEEAKLKVVVIENTADSENIINGEYQEVIAKLSSKVHLDDYQTFEKYTALCVAYLKSNNSVKSESACSSALRSIKRLDLAKKDARYLKAISYNNRAIARYLSNDIVGAVSDLQSAKSLDKSELSSNNLMALNSKIQYANYNESSTYSE